MRFKQGNVRALIRSKIKYRATYRIYDFFLSIYIFLSIKFTDECNPSVYLTIPLFSSLPFECWRKNINFFPFSIHILCRRMDGFPTMLQVGDRILTW